MLYKFLRILILIRTLLKFLVTKGDDALVYQNGEPSYLFTTEIEKSLNFPQHFTDVANLSATRRLKLLGKTWDIAIVEAILQPLCTLFRKKVKIDF